MNKSDFIRLSGWLMILGAVAFLPGAVAMLFWEPQAIDGSAPSIQLAAFAVFWAPLLLAVGMLGLRAHYRIGGGVLLFGAAVGGLLVIVGTLVQFLTLDYSVSEAYYGVWLGGVLALNLCLSIFGVMALKEKPLPRWNWLPLVPGRGSWSSRFWAASTCSALLFCAKHRTNSLIRKAISGMTCSGKPSKLAMTKTGSWKT